MFKPVTTNSTEITTHTTDIQSELPLYINFYCKKYKINLSEPCKKNLIDLFKNHQSDDNLRKEVISMVHGIFLLFKQHPKLIEYLSG